MRAIAILFLVACSAEAQPRVAPLEHAPLTWSMSYDRGKAALKTAKITVTEGEQRGYFDDGTGHPAHTTEPELYWKIPNGRATARFQWNTAAKDWRLDEVRLDMNVTDDQLGRELAQLARRFGKPHRQGLWVRGGVWLVVIPATAADPKTNLWSLSVHYRRDDRPAP